MRKHGWRERACTSGWKRGRLKGSETWAEHKRSPESGQGMGVSPELMKRRRTKRGESVVLDEKAVRRDKPRDVQSRLFERTFLDENNGSSRASIDSHYDDDDRDDVTPRVPACLSMIR